MTDEITPANENPAPILETPASVEVTPIQEAVAENPTPAAPAASDIAAVEVQPSVVPITAGEDVAQAATYADAAALTEKHTLLEDLHAEIARLEADGKAVLEWPVDKLKALLAKL